MSIAEKLTAIAENQQKVYDAGYEIGKTEGNSLAVSILARNIKELSNNDIGSIANYGLSWCSELTRINLPNCHSIGAYALYNCDALTDVHIRHDGGTSYSACAFKDCSSLRCIDLLFRIKTQGILSSTFEGCSSLNTVIIRNNYVVTLGNTNTFTDTPIKNGAGYVYVPEGLVDSYKTATNWSVYAPQIMPISAVGETVYKTDAEAPITTAERNAAILSAYLPTKIRVGEITPFTVTIKNTGVATWVMGTTTHYKLGVFNASFSKVYIDMACANTNGAAGNRIWLSRDVASGEIYKFLGWVKAPETIGKYKIPLQMVLDGTGKFGEEIIWELEVTE